MIVIDTSDIKAMMSLDGDMATSDKLVSNLHPI